MTKLPGTVIPGRARAWQKIKVRARRGTVNFFTKKRAANYPAKKCRMAFVQAGLAKSPEI